MPWVLKRGSEEQPGRGTNPPSCWKEPDISLTAPLASWVVQSWWAACRLGRVLQASKFCYHAGWSFGDAAVLEPFLLQYSCKRLQWNSLRLNFGGISTLVCWQFSKWGEQRLVHVFPGVVSHAAATWTCVHICTRIKTHTQTIKT